MGCGGQGEFSRTSISVFSCSPLPSRALVSTHRESEALISRWNHRIGGELGSVWMKIPENLGRWFLSLGVLGNMRVVDNITIPRQIQPKSRCVETNAPRGRGAGGEGAECKTPATRDLVFPHHGQRSAHDSRTPSRLCGRNLTHFEDFKRFSAKKGARP